MIHHAKNQFFEYKESAKPEITIDSGDEVIFHTMDALNGTVPDGPAGSTVIFPNIDFKVANPSTGPVFIKNSKAGDVLKATVMDIKFGDKGVLAAWPNWGTFGDMVKENTARIVGIQDGIITFNDKIKFPVRPMVGTMGVIPKSGVHYSYAPGVNGANIDQNDIVVGAKVYFPIFVDGAGFGVGDVHASMGSGELSGGAIDARAEVKIKLEVLKRKYDIKRPIIENEKEFIVTSNASDVYKATKIVVREMLDLLMYGLGVSELDAYLLITAAGNLRIGQISDQGEGLIDNTLRLAFPKYLNNLNWKKLF